MTLHSKTLAVLVAVIMFGGILFSSAVGWWQTESNKQAAAFTSGEFAGEANPADIRGSYTFGDVESNFGLPAVILAQAFGVESADPAAFQVKSLEEMYVASPEEVGTGSVRLFTALYTGLPYDLSAGDYLPDSAADLLLARALTPEQTAYLETHRVPDLGDQEAPVTEAAPAAVETASQAEAAPSAEATHEPSSDGMIRGKTTFTELLDLGVSREAVEAVLGMPLPPALGMTVKDFCTENGLSFETVKTELQVLVP